MATESSCGTGPETFYCSKRAVRFIEMTEIRQIEPDEWALLKRVRLAALADSPDAFARTVDQARQMPDSTWHERARSGAEGQNSFCALAMQDANPVGIAVGLPDAEDTTRAYLVSMWVAPAHRGSDVASSLLGKVSAWAAGRGAQVLLAGVKPCNARATAFYRKMGFEPYEGNPPEHPATSGCDVVLAKELREGGERALKLLGP